MKEGGEGKKEFYILVRLSPYPQYAAILLLSLMLLVIPKHVATKAITSSVERSLKLINVDLG